MKLPAIHHSENLWMSFPQVLDLAFAEGHNIKILLPHTLYQTGNQLTSGREGVGMEEYSVVPSPPSLLLFSHPVCRGRASQPVRGSIFPLLFSHTFHFCYSHGFVPAKPSSAVVADSHGMWLPPAWASLLLSHLFSFSYSFGFMLGAQIVHRHEAKQPTGTLSGYRWKLWTTKKMLSGFCIISKILQ